MSKRDEKIEEAAYNLVNGWGANDFVHGTAPDVTDLRAALAAGRSGA